MSPEVIGEDGDVVESGEDDRERVSAASGNGWADTDTEEDGDVAESGVVLERVVRRWVIWECWARVRRSDLFTQIRRVESGD